MAKKAEKENEGFFSRLFGLGGSSKSKPSENSPAPHSDNSVILEPSQVSVDFTTHLGLGSFGTVYKGLYMGKPCAVKVFHTGIVKGDIAREAEVTSLIQVHENIVQVYGLWYEKSGDGNTFPDGQPALVMELCSTNLKSYLDWKNKNPRDTYTLKDKLTILCQVTKAMIYLHSQCIVHGDLSAANILLQFGGQQSSPVLTAKVGDFGQARVLNPKTLKHLTKVHGKDDIMPPEVLKGDIVTLTIEVDVFSFGCLVPYVATCVYPKPAPAGSEFGRREHCLRGVTETSRRIFQPLMKKCLADKSHLRGTFEDVLSILGPKMNEFAKGTYSETEEEKTREIEKLKSNLLEYERKVQTLQEEKETIVVSYGELEREKKSLETTNKLLNNGLNQYSSKINALEQEKNTMKQKIGELSYLEKLNVGALHEDYKQLDKDKRRLDDKCEVLEDEVSQLERKCQDLQTERNALERERSTLKGKLEECETLKTKLEMELKATTSKRAELTNKLNSTTSSLDSTSQRCGVLKSEIHVLSGNIKTLKSEKEALDRDLTASTVTKRSLEKQFRTVQEKVSRLEEERDSLKGKLQLKTSKNFTLNAEVSEYKKTCDEETTRANGLQVKLRKANENVLTLKAEVEQLKHDLKDRTSERDGFKKKTEELDEARIKMGKDKENMERVLQLRKQDMNEKDEEIRKLKNTVEELVKQTSEDFSDMKSENEKLEKKFREKEEAYNKAIKMVANADKERDNLEAEKKKLEEKIDEMQQLIDSKTEVIQMYEGKVASMEESSEKSHVSYQRLEKLNQELNDKLAEAEVELGEASKSNETLRSIEKKYMLTCIRQTNDIEALKEKMAMMKMFLTKAEEHFAVVKDELKVARGELQSVRECLKSYHQNRLCVAVSEWRRVKVDFATLQTSHSELKEKYKALENDLVDKEDIMVKYKCLQAEHEKFQRLAPREHKVAERERALEMIGNVMHRTDLAKKLREEIHKDVKATVDQNLTQYFRDHPPVCSSSSSDQMDGALEKSLAVDDDKIKLHLIISHKQKFIEELKAEKEELLTKVEDLKRELRLKESFQHDSPVTKMRQREWEQKERNLIAKLNIWIQAYFLVQCYPFFIHDFHLRGLHCLAPNVQQLTSSEPRLFDVEVLHSQSIKGKGSKGIFETSHVALTKLFEAVVQAMTTDHSLSLSVTFFHFAGSVTLYRFHIVVDFKVLVHDDPIHRCSDEGGAIPRAFFTYASVQLKDGVTPPHIKASGRGAYYLTRMRGQVDLMTKSLGLREQEEVGAIKLITDHLDGRIARHLDNRYASFAKPKAVPFVPDCHVRELQTAKA